MELKSIFASNSSYLLSYSRIKLELCNPTAHFPFLTGAKSPLLASHCLFGGGSITPKTKHLREWGAVYGFMGNGLVEQGSKKYFDLFFGSRANGVPQFAMHADNQEEESVAEDHDDGDGNEGKNSDEERSGDEEESTEDEDEDEDGEDDEEKKNFKVTE